MCGRYVNVSKLEAVEKRFQVRVENPEMYRIHVNVGPGAKAPVITQEQPDLLQFYTFGLTPTWSKKRMYLFNARAEGDNNPENDPRFTGAKGIIMKPAFRSAIRSHRCLVIADAFLEGPEKEKLDKPHLVYLKEGKRPFAFAGIYEEWVDKETGEVFPGYAIITTVSNGVTQKIGHHRSPVILHPEQERLWLDSSLSLSEVTSMLAPYPSEEMNAYPISNAIKNPRAEGLDLLQPTGQRIFPEYEYVLYEDLKLEGMGHTSARKRKLDESE
ncbi:MAG: SOS response-associated peptidase [Bacteroidota bacterium]|nr:SOS response-associated peptidase [Bacteroidota bacterium]MDX5431268.1 SOS response-associated peptidase [Bacteroidota bacterium]MDX5470007.1 SOS response-associated peptidase [Bacteroidota bacterium]